MRRLLLIALLGAVALVALLVLAGLRLPSRQLAVEPAPPRAVAGDAVAGRLGEALRFRTISTSTDPATVPLEAFDAFADWLAASYPRLHARLERERLAQSLLYTWRGTDPDLAPTLLLAHHDVVPAESVERWSRPPFEGRVEDGFVWGRGAIDDKGALVAICEAVEALLAEDFAPRRSLLLAFGHDEEVGGEHGAGALAAALAARGVRAQLVLDEGAAIVATDMLPGVSRPIALVGVAEKGSATLELVARAEGGHSSTPPRQTAAGVLASAIQRLEANPMPGGVVGVTRTFFEWMAPELPLYGRTALANLWLFERPLDWALSREPGINALLRTTTAVTMLAGAPKDNVLPVEAIAGVNFRLLPGDTAAALRDRVEALVADPRVEVRFKYPPREASDVAPSDGPAFALLQRTIQEVFPDVLVAPFLTVGGTDARHYRVVSENLYRFMPFRFGSQDLKLPHGIDERVSVASLADAVRFYARLVENASAAPDSR